MTIATNELPPVACSTWAPTTDASASDEPTDRSIPRTMMTPVIPNATREMTAVCTAMLKRLNGLRKPVKLSPKKTVVTTIARTRMIVMRLC
jgi:hypothetical protein